MRSRIAGFALFYLGIEYPERNERGILRRITTDLRYLVSSSLGHDLYCIATPCAGEFGIHPEMPCWLKPQPVLSMTRCVGNGLGWFSLFSGEYSWISDSTADDDTMEKLSHPKHMTLNS